MEILSDSQQRFSAVGVDVPEHLIGKSLIPELYVRTREVPEYFPPFQNSSLVLKAVIDAVLAPPTPNREPHLCIEPGCAHEGTSDACHMACPDCGCHPPYCGCV